MKYFAERIWAQTALLLLALVPVTLVAGTMDERVLNDISVWIKPLKFHTSTALHLLTFAVLTCFLRDEVRKAGWLGGLAAVSAVAAMGEILIITVQAARGTASHFNFSTPMDAMLYTAMGVGVMVLMVPVLVLGIRFLTASKTPSLTPGLKLGAGLGLTLGFVLTMVIAGYMSMQPGGHWVDAPRTDLGGLPIVGWSRQGGDLRVPHFFATHLMQVLPAIGYVADRVLRMAPGRARLLVLICAIIGVALAIGTFLQALAGQPFIGL